MIPAGPGFIPGLPVRGRRHQRRIIGPRAGINESVSDIKQGMSHVRARAALALVCVLVAAAVGSAQPGNRRRIAEVTPIVEANGVHSGTVVRTALQVRLPEGFHVNSHQPRDPALIPLTLAVDAPPHVAVTGTALPTPSDLRQEGQDVPLSVFEREFSIGVRLALAADMPIGPIGCRFDCGIRRVTRRVATCLRRSPQSGSFPSWQPRHQSPLRTATCFGGWCSRPRTRRANLSTAIPAAFRILLDPDYTFTQAYGLRWDAPKETAYPSTFVLDRNGTVTFAQTSRAHGDRVPTDVVLKALAGSRH